MINTEHGYVIGKLFAMHMQVVLEEAYSRDLNDSEDAKHLREKIVEMEQNLKQLHKDLADYEARNFEQPQ
jgi:hypothetical protein